MLVKINQTEEHIQAGLKTSSCIQYVLHQTPFFLFSDCSFVLWRFNFSQLTQVFIFFFVLLFLKAPPAQYLSFLITFFPLQGLCTVTAAFLHFFFLASFCWVLTEAWQSYLAVIGKTRSRLIRKRFLCLGWGMHAHTRTHTYG